MARATHRRTRIPEIYRTSDIAHQRQASERLGPRKWQGVAYLGPVGHLGRASVAELLKVDDSAGAISKRLQNIKITRNEKLCQCGPNKSDRQDNRLQPFWMSVLCHCLRWFPSACCLVCVHCLRCLRCLHCLGCLHCVLRLRCSLK